MKIQVFRGVICRLTSKVKIVCCSEMSVTLHATRRNIPEGFIHSLFNFVRPSYLAVMVTFTRHLLHSFFQRLLDTVPIAMLFILYFMHSWFMPHCRYAYRSLLSCLSRISHEDSCCRHKQHYPFWPWVIQPDCQNLNFLSVPNWLVWFCVYICLFFQAHNFYNF